MNSRGAGHRAQTEERLVRVKHYILTYMKGARIHKIPQTPSNYIAGARTSLFWEYRDETISPLSESSSFQSI